MRDCGRKLAGLTGGRNDDHVDTNRSPGPNPGERGASVCRVQPAFDIGLRIGFFNARSTHHDPIPARPSRVHLGSGQGHGHGAVEIRAGLLARGAQPAPNPMDRNDIKDLKVSNLIAEPRLSDVNGRTAAPRKPAPHAAAGDSGTPAQPLKERVHAIGSARPELPHVGLQGPRRRTAPAGQPGL